jgi:hypothetical protein
VQGVIHFSGNDAFDAIERGIWYL